MEKITSANIGNYVVNGVWNIAGSMKSDGESKEPKQFTLRVKFNDIPVLDIINKALDPTKIQWVNGQGRPNFDKWTNRQSIDVDFKSPGRVAQLTPQEQFKADLVAAGVDPSDKEAVMGFYEEWITK